MAVHKIVNLSIVKHLQPLDNKTRHHIKPFINIILVLKCKVLLDRIPCSFLEDVQIKDQ